MVQCYEKDCLFVNQLCSSCLNNQEIESALINFYEPSTPEKIKAEEKLIRKYRSLD